MITSGEIVTKCVFRAELILGRYRVVYLSSREACPAI